MSRRSDGSQPADAQAAAEQQQITAPSEPWDMYGQFHLRIVVEKNQTGFEDLQVGHNYIWAKLHRP